MRKPRLQDKRGSMMDDQSLVLADGGAPQAWKGDWERHGSQCWCLREMTGWNSLADGTLLGERRRDKYSNQDSFAPWVRGYFWSSLDNSMGTFAMPLCWSAFLWLFLQGFSDRGWTSHAQVASLLLEFCCLSSQGPPTSLGDQSPLHVPTFFLLEHEVAIPPPLYLSLWYSDEYSQCLWVWLGMTGDEGAL